MTQFAEGSEFNGFFSLKQYNDQLVIMNPLKHYDDAEDIGSKSNFGPQEAVIVEVVAFNARGKAEILGPVALTAGGKNAILTRLRSGIGGPVIRGRISKVQNGEKTYWKLLNASAEEKDLTAEFMEEHPDVFTRPEPISTGGGGVATAVRTKAATVPAQRTAPVVEDDEDDDPWSSDDN